MGARSRRQRFTFIIDLVAATALVISAVVAVRRSPPQERQESREPHRQSPVSDPDVASGWSVRLDRWQRSVPPLAFLVGVVKKFGDDRAGRLAALIAYYGFFSLFPLLLVAVTVVGYALGDRSAEEIKSSALGQIPVVGDRIGAQVGPLQGSVIALVIGVATALWAGLGCMQAAQDAMNEVWAVPRLEQPSFLVKRVRSAGVLAVIGVSLLAGGTVSQLLSLLPGLGGGGRLVAVVASVVVNTAVYVLAFQILAAGGQRWRSLVPGAVVAGIGYTALQLGGQWYVRRAISGAEDTYGAFAVVIGLLGWLYLLAQVSLFAAEVNVVHANQLWPRSLRADQLTTADEEIVRAAARGRGSGVTPRSP